MATEQRVKTRFKIVSDHKVSELQVCRENRSLAPGGRSRSLGKWLTSASALTYTALAAAGVCMWTFVAFDWGYFLVKQLADQPDSPQGSIAWLLQVFFLAQIGFASLIPWLGVRLKQSVGLSLGFAAAFLAFVILQAGTVHIADFIEFSPVLAASFLMSAAACAVSHPVVSWLRTMNNKPLFPLLTNLPLAASGVLLVVFDSLANPFHERYLEGAVAYILVVLGMATAGSFLCGSQRKQTGIGFAIGAAWPLLVTACANVLMTLVSLGLDQFHIGLDLGWRALASAAVIFTATAVPVYLGGITGTRLRHHFANRNSAQLSVIKT